MSKALRQAKTDTPDTEALLSATRQQTYRALDGKSSMAHDDVAEPRPSDIDVWSAFGHCEEPQPQHQPSWTPPSMYKRVHNISKTEAIRLSTRYCPTFKFHRYDKHFPVWAEEYIVKCELWHWDTKILRRGQVTIDSLVEHYELAVDKRGWRLRLHSDPNVPEDAPLYDSEYTGHSQDPENAPVYTRTRLIMTADGDVYLELNYILFYFINGVYTIMGCGLENCLGPRPCPLSCVAGYHECDIEHVTVRVNPVTEELHSVFFAAHRNRDGTWIAAADLDKDEDSGRWIAYVAKSGHGHYWKSGCWPRIWCVANDWTDHRGLSWTPHYVVALSDGDCTSRLSRDDVRRADSSTRELYDEKEQDERTLTYTNRWMRYLGDMGSQGVAAIGSKTWWIREFPYSRGAFKRWWCCCLGE